MSDDVDGSAAVRTKLSVMMFLQFFVWGAWFTTLGPCLGKNGLAAIIGAAYGTAPIAAIFAPLFLGLIADRFFSSERVFGVLLLIGGAAMCAVPHFAQAMNAGVVQKLFLVHMLCYMPTLGLGNSVAFSHIKTQTDFSAIRVWGTIGWIVAGLFNGFMGWTQSLNMFYLAGGSALALGLYSFALPHTPPPAAGQPVNLRALLMFDALKLLGKPAFFVFMLCSTLICIPLAYYYGITADYLTDSGFTQAASSMTIGQMSEIVFMLLIPFFFRRLGVKYMILVGMLAWVSRYLLFAFAAPTQAAWMLFIAIALHGICYDFFFVTGFIYADQTAAKEIRSQVQSMLVFFTQGVGMYFGYQVAFGKVASVTQHTELAAAIAAARPAVDLTFGQKLAQMFSVKLPEVIDPTLLANTMAQWKAFWVLPAIMAGAIAVLFAVAFHDRKQGDAA